jgi:hypothetical protein
MHRCHLLVLAALLVSVRPPTASGETTAANRLNVKSAVDGKYSDVAVNDARLFMLFPPSLKKEKRAFRERLAVVVPVVSGGGYWMGSGCKVHECGSEEAAWVIDQDNPSKTYAVILRTGEPSGESPRPTFWIYGSPLSQLPAPLLGWLRERGLKESSPVTVQ